MSELFPSFKAGLIGKGVYTDKLLFGGFEQNNSLSPLWTVSTPENMVADALYRNIKVTSVLSTYSTGDPLCYRIYCSDTLTLGVGGTIECDGGAGLGVWTEHFGSIGFKEFEWPEGSASVSGTLGISGSGGDAAEGVNGYPGTPDPENLSSQKAARWLGGGGGAGASVDGKVGGAGGVVIPVVNYYDPLIYTGGSVLTHTLIDPGDETFAMLMPFLVCGGAGGGGAGGVADSGGGGAGGGVVFIAANKIVMDGGSVTANGQTTQTGGGGGGGGGGAVIIVCSELVWTGSGGGFQAAGGNGGGLGSTDGLPGNVLIFSNQAFLRFSGSAANMVEQEDYEAALVKYQAKGTPFNTSFG